MQASNAMIWAFPNAAQDTAASLIPAKCALRSSESLASTREDALTVFANWLP